MSRKVLNLIIILMLTITVCAGCEKSKKKKEVIPIKEEQLEKLPLPEVTGGARGELGIDKNINESNIDDYLNRSDSVYRDMRMLEDPANYESIGGDRYLSGYIKGFEVVPLPYLIPVDGLPESVGKTYSGKTLFSKDSNGKYIANYEESLSVLEELFPKDKVIFLMCGGGGYAGMTKNLLVSLGYDENKIYNIGGYWYYEGKNNVEVKKVVDGKTTYDFESVPYHKIEFDKLTESKQNVTVEAEVKGVKLNVSTLALNEGEEYKLKATITPLNASDKTVTWESSDTQIAKVSSDGKVTALKKGNAIITVTTKDGNKKAICKLTVNKKENTNYIQLDNLSKEANQFNNASSATNDSEMMKIVCETDKNGKYIMVSEHQCKLKAMYNDLYTDNEVFNKVNEQVHKRMDTLKKQNLEMLNNFGNTKKSLIILLEGDNCAIRPFSLVLSAKKILKANNIPYFKIYTMSDDNYLKSNLKHEKINGHSADGSIVIVSKGKTYAYTDPNKDNFENDNEVKNWLKKYINIK